GLAGDAAPQAGRSLGLDLRLRVPLGDLHHARLEQVEAVEEAGYHLAGAAYVVALGQVLVHPPDHLGHRLGRDVAGRVGDGQVAAGRDGAEQPGHDPPGLLEVGDVVQDGQEHDRDGLAEVQGAARLLEDLVRVPQVGVEVRGDARRAAG